MLSGSESGSVHELAKVLQETSSSCHLHSTHLRRDIVPSINEISFMSFSLCYCTLMYRRSWCCTQDMTLLPDLRLTGATEVGYVFRPTFLFFELEIKILPHVIVGIEFELCMVSLLHVPVVSRAARFTARTINYLPVICVPFR